MGRGKEQGQVGKEEAAEINAHMKVVSSPFNTPKHTVWGIVTTITR